MRKFLDAKFVNLTEKVGELAAKVGELTAKVDPPKHITSTSKFLLRTVLQSFNLKL